MKNALLIVNVLLVIAVATLFFLYFSRKTPQLSAAVSANNTEAAGPQFRIAYFEMDSIESNYNYFKDVRELFRNKEAKLNNDLLQIKNQYNKLWEETNQNQASLSEEEKIKRKQTLDMLEQSYKSKQEMQGAELQSEGFRYRQEITKKIQEYLKKYNSEKGYAFILSNSNDLIYYKDTVYNITDDLLKGLNADYKPKK